MSGRVLALWVLVLSGLIIAGVCSNYTLADWAKLDASYRRYQTLANSLSATLIQLSIAEAAENRHRINCFAEGMGVLLGSAIAAIGVHGLSLLPPRRL